MSSAVQPVQPFHVRGRATTAIVLSLWFAASLVAGLAGAFRQDDPSGAPVPLAVFALSPVLAFLIAIAASEPFRRFVRSLDLRVLTFVQVFRLVGLAFLPLMAAGKLPAAFALPAGLGDALVGITAPLVAGLVVPRLPRLRSLYVAWAAFGILDLVVAVSSGLLHSPTRLGVLAGPVTTALIGTPPLSLLPTFLVPLAVIAHVAALQQVLARGETPGHTVARPGGA